jgi:hypothetical protein
MQKKKNQRRGRRPRRRPDANKLAAEFGYLVSRRDTRVELLPGGQGTVAIRRGRNIVGLLTLGDDVTARKLLGMAQRPLRSKALDRAWELERRSGAAEQTHAN